jgi:dihydroorotate dehydrogenase (fumarate)
MTDLHTTYLGLRLRSPLIASPSPMTGDLDRIEELAEAGAGAVVLPSLFEEQIEHEIDETRELREYNAGVDNYMALVQAAKRRVDIPIIASLNGVSVGTWLRYTRLLEEAGADAVELNLYAVAADSSVSGAALESEQLELVSLLRDDVAIPLAVKLSPYYSSFSAFAVALQGAGADGITMFNRFYLPDLDLETLDVEPRIALSNPDELRLPLRWIGILRDQIQISIAGSTGVHRGTDAAKLILAGADVAMSTSALLRHGPSHLVELEAELRSFMDRHGYGSVDDMRGAARRGATADPDAYERANYIGNLASYAPRH